VNPELQRNAWLELTPARLGFVAIAVALIYGVLSTLPDEVNDTATVALLGVVTGLWGARRAADAVPAEVEGRTWDTQRLSAIGPWAMCWGKLLGATSLAWCTTALVLLGYAGTGGSAWPDVVKTVAATALFQAGSFWASVLLLRTGGRRVRGHTTLAQLVGFCTLSGVSSFTAAAGWYGLRLDPRFAAALGFVLLSLLALFGAWRAMRAELQYRNLPWGLAVALAVMFVLQAGHPLPPVMLGEWSLLNMPALLGGGAAFGALTVIGALIVTTLLAPKDPIAIRSWLVALRSGATARALEVQPVWITALVAALVATIIGMGAAERATGFLLPGLLLLALRDSAVVLAFTMGTPFARGHLAALVALALLHLVLPGLAATVLGGRFELFRPHPDIWPVSLLLQAAIAVGFALWRLHAVGALLEARTPQPRTA
jgi:hypothetical protein